MHCSLIFLFSSFFTSRLDLLTPRLAQMESNRQWEHVKMGFEAVVESHNGLKCWALMFLMSSLFGGFNRSVGWQRQEGAKGWGRRRVGCSPEMKWLIECRINSANNHGSPSTHHPFRKEKLERMEGKRRGGWGGGVEKIPATLWGESCYWKAIKLAFSRID